MLFLLTGIKMIKIKVMVFQKKSGREPQKCRNKVKNLNFMKIMF